METKVSKKYYNTEQDWKICECCGDLIYEGDSFYILNEGYADQTVVCGKECIDWETRNEGVAK